MKNKVFEWIKRYLPAEIISIILTLASSVFTYKLTKNNLTTALVGTWVGNIGYFGTILLTDIFQTNRALAYKNKPYTLKIFGRNIRALFVEFGVAEFFDSLFVRPTLMYYLPVWLNDVSLGVIIAKFTADITFYVPAIVAYELSKKKLRRFE
ncbi:MAG: hypothetical protein ACOVO2_07910 [Emticicia sp.]|uniref:hypothetical protein n=1 Tax=Emticicia sp. TaxID=1930953 RepID=UPI003BA7D232